MSKKILYVLATAAILLGVAGNAAAGGRPLMAILTGDAEVGAGDPDGSGVMDLTANPGLEQICWTLTIDDIAAPTRAHIHSGQAGVNGPVVVFFFDTVIAEPIPVPEDLSGCADASRQLIKEIMKNPAEFYVNVHNEEYPAGAVRGQLMR